MTDRAQRYEVMHRDRIAALGAGNHVVNLNVLRGITQGAAEVIAAIDRLANGIRNRCRDHDIATFQARWHATITARQGRGQAQAPARRQPRAGAGTRRGRRPRRTRRGPTPATRAARHGRRRDRPKHGQTLARRDSMTKACERRRMISAFRNQQGGQRHGHDASPTALSGQAKRRRDPPLHRRRIMKSHNSTARRQAIASGTVYHRKRRKRPENGQDRPEIARANPAPRDGKCHAQGARVRESACVRAREGNVFAARMRTPGALKGKPINAIDATRGCPAGWRDTPWFD